jgi:transcriptional regulator with XRE-family HTH domain
METVFIVDLRIVSFFLGLTLFLPILISTDPAADARLTSIYQEIGNRIARARKKSRLSQQDLATRIGLQRTSVTNIEKGRQKIMVHTLIELAQHLSVELDELLPRQDMGTKHDVTSLLERGVRGTLKPGALRFIEQSALKGQAAAPKTKTTS